MSPKINLKKTLKGKLLSLLVDQLRGRIMNTTYSLNVSFFKRLAIGYTFYRLFQRGLSAVERLLVVPLEEPSLTYREKNSKQKLHQQFKLTKSFFPRSTILYLNCIPVGKKIPSFSILFTFLFEFKVFSGVQF